MTIKLEIKPSDALYTKFGIARINNNGYYQITSRKEGNKGKLLHRLIWEKWYGKLSSQTHLHHIDENPLNNCILNLEPMDKSKHMIYHNQVEKHCWYGKRFSEEHKLKLSKSRNVTGYYNVCKIFNEKCRQGFFWRYQYYDGNKRKAINRTDIEELEKAVKERGLLWKNLNST